jgi:uncharacterized protein (DUF1697 family)
MPRYVAFLRGVSPMNAKMPELKRAFEFAGFSDVRTLLSSGNVAFNARAASERALQRRAESAMEARLARPFRTIVRSREHLQSLLDGDPFAAFDLPPSAKCVVTFLRQSIARRIELPIERDGTCILKLAGAEVLSAYLPGSKGTVLMSMLERTFGSDITTRTLETVRKCARA